MSVYENVRTVATRTKLETHLLNNDCVLVRETRSYEDISSEGFKSMKSSDEAHVFEYVMTSAMLKKRLAGKEWKPGVPVVRPQYGKKPSKDYLRLTVRDDEWMERMRSGQFNDDRDRYNQGREDVYTAIVEDGMSPDNLIVVDSDGRYFDRYGKRMASPQFFDYIGGGSVTSARYRDMKAVAEALLARDDVRIVNEHSWSGKTNRAKTVEQAIDEIPYYNRDGYPGGQMIQFYWTPSQEVFDRVLIAQSENGRQQEWSNQDFRATALVDLDLFGLNQYLWTDEERDARAEEHRRSDEDY